ncbi:MAG: hypothetical protein GY898_21635 [Proteobacteria bacterium]|nr:hypothetical protein [Pseudomonadota bacterium]
MNRSISLVLTAALLFVAGCADLAGLEVSIQPEPGRLDVDLVATVTTPVEVTEEDGLEYGYEWRVDGVLQDDLTTATVPWDRTSPDELWAVKVVPWDGSRYGTAAKAEVLMPSSPDHDGDGFEGPAGDGTDCDDADADVSPDADEDDSNGIDDDCDDAIDEFTFTRIHTDIIQLGCSCHAPINGPALLGNLATYDGAYDALVDVVAHQAPSMDLVEPYDPDFSYLMHKLDGTHFDVPGGHGSQMPPDVPGGLSDELKDGIRAWIWSGAPKD